MPATMKKARKAPTKAKKGRIKPVTLKTVADLAVERMKERKTPKKLGERIVLLRPSQIIAPWEDNPRWWQKDKDPHDVAKSYFASNDFKNLCRSFNSEGIITPIIVKDNGDDTFTIMDGWTRLEWAKDKAKKKPNFTIRAVVNKTVTDKDELHRIIANLARNSYSPLAEAEAFDRILKKNESIAGVVRVTGRSRGTITNRLRLLGLPKQVKHMLTSEKMNQVAAERITKLPGYNEFIKASENTDGMSEKDWEACEQFDRATKFIIKTMDEQNRAATVKQFTERHVLKFFNRFQNQQTVVGKKASKSAKPRIRVDEIIEVGPSDAGVFRFLTVYAIKIVEKIMAGKRETCPEIQEARKIMEVIGTVSGWCATADLVHEFLDDEDEPVYGEEVAKAKCDDLVRSQVCTAWLEMTRNEIPKGHALSDGAKYKEFYRRDIPLEQLIKELATVAVSVLKSSKAEVEEEEEMELDDTAV